MTGLASGESVRLHTRIPGR